jgi:uncharacterized protein (DUF1697 family)
VGSARGGTPSTRVAALVRGINVGKAKQVAMTDLATALADVGGTDVRTYLRSGNAVLEVPAAAARTPTALSRLGRDAEAALLARSGVSARVLVVTADALRAVAAANPFPDLVGTPKLLHVAFCDAQPDGDVVDRLGARHGRDELSVGDRVVYLAYRDGSSVDSPLAKVLAGLGVTTTTRNWSTVQALLTRCDDPPPRTKQTQ